MIPLSLMEKVCPLPPLSSQTPFNTDKNKEAALYSVSLSPLQLEKTSQPFGLRLVFLISLLIYCMVMVLLC